MNHPQPSATTQKPEYRTHKRRRRGRRRRQGQNERHLGMIITDKRRRPSARLSLYLHLLLSALEAVALLSSAWIVDFNNPVVHTQYGSIRGRIDERKTKFNRRPICTFLSIPFARPPVGINRFLVSTFTLNITHRHSFPIICTLFICWQDTHILRPNRVQNCRQNGGLYIHMMNNN